MNCSKISLVSITETMPIYLVPYIAVVLRKPVDSSEPGAFPCSICCEHYYKQDFFALKCGHEFCAECSIEHVTTLINNASISCMQQGCPKFYTLNHLHDLRVKPDLINQFVQTNQDFKVAVSTKLKYCPSPNCDSILKKPCCSDKAICAICNDATCFKCGGKWHPQKTDCMAFADFASGRKDQYWPCPTCSTPIEKTEGCNHMTCTRCKQHFCWVCKEGLDKNYTNHFYDSYGDDGYTYRQRGARANYAKRLKGASNEILSFLVQIGAIKPSRANSKIKKIGNCQMMEIHSMSQ